MSANQVARAAGLLGLAVVLSAGRAAPPASGTDDDKNREAFYRLHGMIRPQRGETRWAELPWMTNLHEARKKATKEGKLLAVWRAGGGHPLGFV